MTPEQKLERNKARFMLALWAFIFIGGVSTLFLSPYITAAIEASKTPEQRATEAIANAAAKQKREAEEAEYRKKVAEYEAYWKPIVDANNQARTYDFENCKDRGLMIPDNGRYREWLAKCMAAKGYELSFDWLAG